MIQSEVQILDKIKTKGYWEIEIRPVKFLGDKLERAKCQSLVKESQIDLRGWPYPFVSNKIEEFYLGQNCAVGLVNHDNYAEIWKMFQSGQFKHYVPFWEDWEPSIRWYTGFTTSFDETKPKKVKGIDMTTYTITEIFKFASNLAEKQTFDDNVRISLKLHNTFERSLATSEPYRMLYKDYKCMMDSITFEKIYAVNDLIKNFADLAIKTTIEIFHSFNWQSQDIEKAIKPVQDKFLKGYI